MVDDAPKAKWYYSDAFDAYSRLWYQFGRYAVSNGKEDTYSVEAWVVLPAVSLAVHMRLNAPFVCSSIASTADNSTNKRFPAYPAHVKDFLTSPY